MSAIRKTLKKSRFVHELGKNVKRTAWALATEARHRNWRREQEPIVASYLRATAEPKLHFGCGPMVMEGWLNTNTVPVRERGVIYLDITEPLPFPDVSFDHLYSEHLYDRALLRRLMKLAGFDAVTSCKIKQSEHTPLAGPEQHGRAITDVFNEPQTMVLEGTRTS